MTFRNCQVAAPLKRAARPLNRKRGLAFRNCQVAAPLKLVQPLRSHQALPPLPQLSSCGPIEAERSWA